MKILLYSRVFPPAVGGMERFAESLARWLAKQAHEVTVVTLTPDTEGADSSRPYRVLRRPPFPRVVRAMRRADVVHINGLSLWGIGAALLAGHRPVVTHAGHQAICPTGLAWSMQGKCPIAGRPGPCGACLERGLRASLTVRAHYRGMFLAGTNVCISHYLHRRLAPPRGTVIYNPVSDGVFAHASPGPGEDGLIAFAGRLVQEKGVDLLLRTLALVPDARLEVAGDGPMRGEWERLAEDLGLRHRVRFLGSLPFSGVAELYARAAVVCVPTVCEEAFGYAAAEAMALARPVVATPRGALPELLTDGRGYVAADMTPKALAAALAQALQDREGRLQAGIRAGEFARQFLSMEALGPRYVQTYHQVRSNGHAK